MRERVLVVDDAEPIRALLVHILEHEGFRCATAEDATVAREWIGRAPFDLVVCDVVLPDGSGIDLMRELLPAQPHLAAIMISGLSDVALAEEALRVGAYGYIVKPFGPNEVLIGVLAALKYRREQASAAGDSRRSWGEETIERLCIALEARDAETAAHIRTMSDHCWAIARAMGADGARCDMLRTASSMHDVGKVAVPDHVLLKPGELTPAERAEMQRHAEVGYRILAGSRAELLQLAATIAWTHHERVDGGGYPRGLSGDDIPVEGRIASIADVFDALTRDRVYRPRFSRADALELMASQRGSAFDPAVFDAFASVTE